MAEDETLDLAPIVNDPPGTLISAQELIEAERVVALSLGVPMELLSGGEGYVEGEFIHDLQAPRRGWSSGKTAPRHTEHEIKAAVRMGYAAMEAQRGRSVALKLPEDELRRLRANAELVLTLAKIHQIDAIRVALIDHEIDPRFSGPIVADVCFGGASRIT